MCALLAEIPGLDLVSLALFAASSSNINPDALAPLADAPVFSLSLLDLLTAWLGIMYPAAAASLAGAPNSAFLVVLSWCMTFPTIFASPPCLLPIDFANAAPYFKYSSFLPGRNASRFNIEIGWFLWAEGSESIHDASSGVNSRFCVELASV